MFYIINCKLTEIFFLILKIKKLEIVEIDAHDTFTTDFGAPALNWTPFILLEYFNHTHSLYS